MSVYGSKMSRMVRTNVVIDEDLIQRVMQLYRLRTKREAIDFALRRLAGKGRSSAVELHGSGWEGDLDELRGGKVPEP
jgi:Arc/MetJ family transcription regulator